jgi:hypothetical protein
MKLEFSVHIFGKYKNIKFHQSHPVRAELFHADGRTDRRTNMTKLIVDFRNYANAPNTEELNFAKVIALQEYSRTSNNGHCRGIQILSVIGSVR